jgi:hypothetical protein
MMKNNIDEMLNRLPVRTKLPVSMNDPNQVIPIYTGTFTLHNVDQSWEIKGSIDFHWFPDMEVKFNGVVVNGPDAIFDYFGNYELKAGGYDLGQIRVLGNDMRGPWVLDGVIRKPVWGEGTIPVSSIEFAIPNIREWMGEAVKEDIGSGKVNKARITLSTDKYTIKLDKLPDYKKRAELLANSGGYMLLYTGCIVKNKGTISNKEMVEWMDRLHHFLYFVNGRRTAPLFLTGVHDGHAHWTDYTPYTVDIHKNTETWSQIHFMNGLNDAWKKFDALWQNELDKDFLISAIHWYVEANSQSGYVEGAIILAQTALELIYNWLLVEQKKLIQGKDSDSISASNKIRLLISQLHIDQSIPVDLMALSAIENAGDGPEIFVTIRNALVHGQEKKRAELIKISLTAKYQALQLALWYIELSLLYILGYTGNYHNRTSKEKWKDTGQPLPWANKS